MDTDIRDLLLDDNLFDPFQDEDEAEEEVVLAAAPDDAGIGAPLEERPVVEKVVLPPEERIAHLFEEAPGQKRLLLRLIDHCREAKTGEEMDAYTLELQENCFSVYSPVILRELLEEAGAIEYVVTGEQTPEGEGVEDAIAEGATRAEGGEAAGEGVAAETVAEGTAVADDDAAPSSSPANPFLRGSVFGVGSLAAEVDEASIQHEILIEDDEELVLDFLEVEEREPGVWVATAAGCAAADAVDDVAATKELLGKEPQYLNIYHEILAYCAAEAYGRSAKELDNLVNDSPLLQEPRRYSGYFVSRLERQGALEWMGGWCVTPAGKEIMAGYESEVNKEACNA
jgi:hypothetical protein